MFLPYQERQELSFGSASDTAALPVDDNKKVGRQHSETRRCSQQEFLEALYSPCCTLKTADVAIASAIASRVDYRTGCNAWFSREGLAAAAKLKNVNSVSNITSGLERKGWLKIERVKRISPSGKPTWSNCYHLRLPKDSKIPNRRSPGKIYFPNDNAGIDNFIVECASATATSLQEKVVSRFLSNTTSFQNELALEDYLIPGCEVSTKYAYQERKQTKRAKRKLENICFGEIGSTSRESSRSDQELRQIISTAWAKLVDQHPKAFAPLKVLSKPLVRSICSKLAELRGDGLEGTDEELFAQVVAALGADDGLTRRKPEQGGKPKTLSQLVKGDWIANALNAAEARPQPQTRTVKFWWRDIRQVEAMTEAEWMAMLAQNTGDWSEPTLGPPPCDAGCLVPDGVIDALGLSAIYRRSGTRIAEPAL